ncbi:MAG: hypothetical protein QOJ50_3193, partial [Cryptosporangiaceae bacterium]|nr:hypothetical protein [Cryptosporangiaceae bacterium]
MGSAVFTRAPEPHRAAAPGAPQTGAPEMTTTSNPRRAPAPVPAPAP